MIKFVSEENGDYLQVAINKNVIEEGILWWDIAEDFQRFLKAIGYEFPEGFDMADILQQAHQDYYVALLYTYPSVR